MTPISHIHDLYGFHQEDLDDLRQRLEAVLDLSMEGCDSLYFGGLYYAAIGGMGSTFRLQFNFGELGDEWAEGEFQEYAVLLYVSCGSEQESDAVEHTVAHPSLGARLLRRKIR